jgi:hypothetical protein
MHLIVDNVTGLPEIDGVDDFIVSVIFIAVQIGCLTTMTYSLSDRGPKSKDPFQTYPSNGKRGNH